MTKSYGEKQAEVLIGLDAERLQLKFYSVGDCDHGRGCHNRVSLVLMKITLKPHIT